MAAPRAVGGLVPDLHHDQRPVPPSEPAGVLAQPGPGRGLPVRGPDALGRPLRDGGVPGRAGGPRAARGLPPGGVRAGRRRPLGHRHDPARAHPGLRRPRRPPRRRALPAVLRDPGPDPVVRRPGPGEGPPPGRPGEGHRHRHDLHLRRHHRRDLVAGAGPARAGRRGSERPSAPRRRPTSSPTRPPTSTSPSSPARPCSAPRSASSSCWARPGRCGASPARSPTR